jgi:DeoR/GlpR family transcriptional regulator of sugar metabolism
MKFGEACTSWNEGRLTQEEAARLSGVCERTFRRYLARYEEQGQEGRLEGGLNRAALLMSPRRRSP